MEEPEVCSLPGGLASVRKQFETQETTTSHNISQYQFHHRTVQETSNSEVMVSSGSRQVIPGSQQLNFNQEMMVSYGENNFTPSYENHQNEEEEDFPRYTTKELRDHFERTIEEAAPQKHVKIGRDINRSKWASSVTQTNIAASEVCEQSQTEETQGKIVTVTDYEDFPPPPAEDPDYLPPPPPDLLQMSSDNENYGEGHLSHEPPVSVNSSKYLLNREAYAKQKSMNELKRLYRHIHPEVRKNIEKECLIDYDDNHQMERHEYTYDYDGCGVDEINDEECGEWEEILPGDVQAMRWMFENKPLDSIKNEIADEEDNNEINITKQEMILGKDVRQTAWMFETKPMDELGSQNTNSTAYKNKFNKSDKGDVRAAAWLFETQTMDTLNKICTEEDLTKEILFTEEDGNATIYMIDNKLMGCLGHTETIDEHHLLNLRSVLEEINGETKTVTSTFDTQFKCIIMGQSSQMLEIKSVRKIETELESSIASRWLFDTQPLDLTTHELSPLKLVCSLSMEDSNKGDWSRWLFEIKTINSPNELDSFQMEKKEIVGADVRKHCLVFETQPMDCLKDDSNARPQTIEEIIGGNVRSARHFFETSPQIARKNCPEVGKLKKATIDEEIKGDVRHQKWRFESQPLELIRDDKKEITRTVNVAHDLTQEDGTSCKADVRKNCLAFETQPMDTFKDDSNSSSLTKEEIIAGNVKSARHYFETIPNEEVKELAEVGKLKKTVALEEEKGDVRHQKWRFESQPLEHIRDEEKEVIRTIDLEEIDKIDVSNYKQMFESTEINSINESQKICIEGLTSGTVKSNKNLFESTPLYAMQDSSGHFHEVKTVRREEIVKGDVTTCKWMFETRPIDQFDESIDKYQVIKGISKQELESGDVKTAKWLFETQPLDAIKYFSNIEDEEIVMTSRNVDIVKGDVKTCKWLFETKPMDVLYEKIELKGENEEEEEMHRGDVKTCTWLFETQALDSIHDENKTVLNACTVKQEDIRGKDVRTACFLFETEKLENLTGEERGSYKYVTQIDISSGDVSRMKYIFENQTSEIMTSTAEEAMQKLKKVQTEDIQKGNVVNCKWLFENQSIDTIHDEESVCNRTVIDVQGGDVNKGRFIFETCSLDKIQDVSSEVDSHLAKTGKIICDEEEKGDVRNYTMMFETQPLYAIQDKEGHYHEVTTVTSEEVTRGDVVGTRWLFETKPLDAIKDTDEVYIIKSVTQQDAQKGDVMSAKWKFETQPLDRIAEEKKSLIKTVEDIQGGNVRINKSRFESESSSQGCVKTVNVSEIQKGDVRSAKWRFETQSIDKIRSMSSENLIETVKKEEVAKGDVKHSVWLFEKNPLDHIKEANEDVETTVIPEEIPKADVKTTTWLFETTPFDDFNEKTLEKNEILGKSIKGTLEELYSQKMVTSKGILIEADEIGDIRMAKYQLMNKQAPEIQREEVISGDLQTIMVNLLNRKERKDQQIVIESEEKGNISSTMQQLFNQESVCNIKREEILRGDIQEAIGNLFNEARSAKHGILIQEDEKGDVQMTIYSLLNKQEDVNNEKEDIVKGDIKSALQRLSCADKTDHAAKITIDDSEKGNVNFYSTCIESGALDYLKQLHLGPGESPSDSTNKVEIVSGDIKGTKLILEQNHAQIERTVEDVIPGDVHNTVKVFMSEPTVSQERHQKEEIIKGDLKTALNSLSESVNQTVVLEKEEVVKGNIPKALRCLERAQKRYKEVEKPDIIPGNIKGALRSLEKSSTSRVETAVEDLVSGDVKATLKSLELAKSAVRNVEKEEILRGDIHTAMLCLQDASSEKRRHQHEIDVQGDVRGAIQTLMETPQSPKMQRSSSIDGELKGDVKMSIKSLYETQEQTQFEKEEVIKGDVKGTIRSLLETAQRESPKVGAYRRVRVKQSPPVKNLKVDAQSNIQKIKSANVVKSSKEIIHSTSNETDSKSVSAKQSTQQSKTVVQHKTITQNHGIKTVKTEFRNLRSNQKGMSTQGKTKVKTDVYILKCKTPDLELPLPPPPPPVTDNDVLPPPPTPPPPSLDIEIDPFLPPPPPITTEPDFLPPPPSQQELDHIPGHINNSPPAKAKKMTVKKVKAPALHPVPKLENKVEFSKPKEKDSKSERMVKKSQIDQSMTQTSRTASYEVPLPAESPKPLKKVYIAPVRFTPPPSPPPSMRGKSSKFITPLIKAEEKYRKLREDYTPPTTPTPTLIHDAVNAAHETLSTKDTNDWDHKTVQTKQKNENKTGVCIHSESHMCNLSNNVVTPNAFAHQDKILGYPTNKSSANQQIIANETSTVVSVQKTASAVKQQVHTATQKTVSIASKQATQSAPALQSAFTDKVQSSRKEVQSVDGGSNKYSITHKVEDVDKEDWKLAKAGKPDSSAVQINAIVSDIRTNTEDVIITNNNIRDLASTTSKEKDSNQPSQTSVNANGKTGKLNPKVKKSSKHENALNDRQRDILSVSNELKAELKETSVVKIINEPKEVKATPMSTVTVSNPDSQPETPIPPKKKKKGKKSKGAAQLGQSKDILAETKTEGVSEVTQTQEIIAFSHIQQTTKEEHLQVKKEVIGKESKVNEDSEKQKAVPVQTKGSQKEETTVALQSTKECKEESRKVPITVTGASEQKEEVTSMAGRTEGCHTQDVKTLMSYISEMQTVSEKGDFETVKNLVNTIPDWVLTPDRKCELKNSLTKSHSEINKDILSHMKTLVEDKLVNWTDETLEKHDYDPVLEKHLSGATARISKICIGSSKVENQTKTSRETIKDEVTVCKSLDIRAPSPSLRMRSPSPTYITIESIRRTDSPQRVTPSPTLFHRPSTPPTPPLRRCETPTSRLNRITPSPTFDKAENLPRLKDATAKLSRGVTPPPLLTHQITERKSEIVESPPTFHRQLKIKPQLVEAQQPDLQFAHLKDDTLISEHVNSSEIPKESQQAGIPLGQDDPVIDEAALILEPSSATVKEKMEFFEEAQKAETNKIYVRKEPIAIPERLGSDTEECEMESMNKEKEELPKADMSELVNKFESQEIHTQLRSEPSPRTEDLQNDTESPKYDTEKVDICELEMPTFDIQAIRNVFELGETSSLFKEEEKDQEELVSTLTKAKADTSKTESSQETNGGSRQRSLIPLHKNDLETVPAEPSAFSETKSITEHFSNVDEFGNKVTGIMTAVTEHSEQTGSSQRAPFSYADAVKRKTAAVRRTETYDEDSTEKLLRNFHKTWTESETVFKSLGYSVSEESTSHIAHQTKIVSSGKTRLGMERQN